MRPLVPRHWAIQMACLAALLLNPCRSSTLDVPWHAAEQPELRESLAKAPGPEGFVWTYLKDVLVRIDPKDASVHVIGKIDPVGWPTFIGRDLYLAGNEHLRRIRKVVPSP